MEQESPFSSYLRQKQRGPGPAIAAGVLVLVAGVAAAWYFFRSPDTEPAPVPPPVVETDSTRPAPDLAPYELPAVDTSDAFVRALLRTLSSHPQFAEWLVTDELVRRFVATIADLARGASPNPHLRFMAPEAGYPVRTAGDGREVDPAGYARYDRMVATFESLDVDGTAELMRRLDPLFEAAHLELGLPDRTFDDDLAAAIRNLLAVDVPTSPPALVAGETGWEYADATLQGRSNAAKHLMRMGPENARRVQARLADLADALGIPY